MDIKRDPPKKHKRNALIALGVVAAVMLTVALSKLEARPPSVARAEVIIDSVQRGPLIRQVRAPGTLVPENIRYVAAVVSGRVENRPLRPGAIVTRNTVILVLSNPDEQMLLLTAQEALAQAEQNLVTLRGSLQSNKLAQEAAIARVRTLLSVAERNKATFEALDQSRKGLASENELKSAREQVVELSTTLRIEEERLKLMESMMAEQIAGAQNTVNSNKAVVQLRRDRIAGLNVIAGIDGQLQSLNLEDGQWINSGTELARVAQPGRFKAVLRVPESQAKDVAVGQLVDVDLHPAIVKGRVMRVDPISQNATVEVEVALEGEMPQGARSDLSVDGTIEIDKIPNTLFVQRPGNSQPDQTVGLFKLEPDGKTAIRTNVKFGKASVNLIEVLAGLQVGDKILISDMGQYDNVNRVRIN
ncbi:MAG TPA: HlyD family efflux transporter periplasmic adaptor subunit [Terriglobia bacterium]|nr:HlyD family efflux transporter periplasmic adaptor subunit [Terriglobia bacterium]